MHRLCLTAFPLQAAADEVQQKAEVAAEARRMEVEAQQKAMEQLKNAEQAHKPFACPTQLTCTE